MEDKVKSNKFDNKYFSIFLVLILSINQIILAFNSTIRSVVSNTYYVDTIIVYSIYFSVILLSFPFLVSKISYKDVLFLAIFLGVFGISMLFALERKAYEKAIIDILLYAIPLYIVGRCIDDYGNAKECFRIASYIIVILDIYIYIFLRFLNNTSYERNLGSSYSLLLASCFIFLLVIQKFKLIDIILFVLSILVLFVLGSRGPLLCLLLTCTIIIIFDLYKKLTYQKIIRFLFFILFSLLTVTFFNNIVMGISEITKALGIETRIGDLISNNLFFQSEGRNEIQEEAIKYIISHPFNGCWLLNDRTIIWQNLMLKDPSSYGYYPHNIALEILMQFGYIWGLIIMGAILYKILKIILKTKDVAAKELLLILIPIVFFPLFISFSYLTYGMLYFLLGFLLTLNSVNKNKKKNVMEENNEKNNIY